MAALVVVAVVAILVVDRLVLTPLLDQRALLNDRAAASQLALKKATSLLGNRGRLERRWREMAGSAGGLNTDPSAAESQMLHAVRDWAQDAGLVLASLKAERTEQDKHFQRILFRATGTGNMGAVGRFLWRIESANVPVRVTDLQLTSRKDGVDDLSLQIGISTLCLSAEPAKPRMQTLANAKEQVR